VQQFEILTDSQTEAPPFSPTADGQNQCVFGLELTCFLQSWEVSRESKEVFDEG
jgi:hypothetical protein